MRGNFQPVREYFEKNKIASPPVVEPKATPRTLEFRDLIGQHILSGVDFEVNGVGNGIRFILDNITYEVTEDEQDGYRSSANPIIVSKANVLNTFPGVKVVVSYYDFSVNSDKELLVIRDIETGKEVIEVGTDFTDSYYPCFINKFHPEGMYINKGR